MKHFCTTVEPGIHSGCSTGTTRSRKEMSDGCLPDPYEQLFAKLREELELHTEIEERLFYPEMKKHPGTKELVGEALEEHGEVKRLLKELAKLSPGEGRWSDMIEELDHAVQHHVREEEEQMIPAARKEISESRANELGWQIEEMKQKASA